MKGVVSKIESIFDELVPDLLACLPGCECCFDFGEEDRDKCGFGRGGFFSEFLEAAAVAIWD